MKDQVLIGAASFIGCRDCVKILMEYNRMQLASVPPPATRKAAVIASFCFCLRGILQMMGIGRAIMMTSVMMVKIPVAAER
jgi:hypothetical protein